MHRYASILSSTFQNIFIKAKSHNFYKPLYDMTLCNWGGQGREGGHHFVIMIKLPHAVNLIHEVVTSDNDIQMNGYAW